MTFPIPCKTVYVWITVAIPFFTQCERNLDLDIRIGDRRLLVEGEFTNDTAFHRIKLHRSGSITTGRPQEAVSGACIYVTDGVDTFRYVETDTKGWYQTPEKCCGKGGHTYHLSITDMDVDGDGEKDAYQATGIMPVPVALDSLNLKFGVNGDGVLGDRAYFTVHYNGPDYIYTESLLNHRFVRPIPQRLGSGEIIRFANSSKVDKVANPGSVIPGTADYYRGYSDVKNGDTITFHCENFTRMQYTFLQALDHQVSSGSLFQDNLYDPLKIPSNLPSNIEPSGKSAGYFLIYSISGISKIYVE
ncbi:MAG: DUF4249 domain-containing protein [Bacteroidales bacterium]|jgi:hypothetical protein|nr:DUF4249 domain-containing protein [Bacteroidales bacterium]